MQTNLIDIKPTSVDTSLQPAQSRLKQPTRIQVSYSRKTGPDVIDESTSKEKKEETSWKRITNLTKKIQILELPVEGRLIIFYASNLILENNLDNAINVLSQYGQKYHFEGERGVCNKANVQKLLAVAFFMYNRNFQKIEGLLNSAKQKFK